MNYDFISTKIGRQPFNSDFRSLIFSDVNQGIRFFGSANANRYQFNLIYFNPAEKDTNSELNTFGLRDQQIAIGNLYIQDFLKLGYTTQFNLHYLQDDGKDAGFVFDNQGFLVRPDPVGVAPPAQPRRLLPRMDRRGAPRLGEHQPRLLRGARPRHLEPDRRRGIPASTAQRAFLELSMDRDWMRYQTSVFYSSGDSDPRDGRATGFDSILDNPQIMGGGFSYWQRQSIRITDRGGVALMQRNSVIPDLRSSKIQGQPNFVNPGILMANVGATADLTQKVSLVGNLTYIRFIEHGAAADPAQAARHPSGRRHRHQPRGRVPAGPHQQHHREGLRSDPAAARRLQRHLRDQHALPGRHRSRAGLLMAPMRSTRRGMGGWTMRDRTRWLRLGTAAVLALGLCMLIGRGAARAADEARAATGADAGLAAEGSAADAGAEIPDSAPKLLRQTQAEADAKSTGCLSCHNGIEPMHVSGR